MQKPLLGLQFAIRQFFAFRYGKINGGQHAFAIWQVLAIRSVALWKYPTVLVFDLHCLSPMGDFVQEDEVVNRIVFRLVKLSTDI